MRVGKQLETSADTNHSRQRNLKVDKFTRVWPAARRRRSAYFAYYRLPRQVKYTLPIRDYLSDPGICGRGGANANFVEGGKYSLSFRGVALPASGGRARDAPGWWAVVGGVLWAVGGAAYRPIAAGGVMLVY